MHAVWCAGLLWWAVSCILKAEDPGTEAGIPRVLILFSNDRLLPANQEFEMGVRNAFLNPDGKPAAEIYGEFLDAVRFPSEVAADAMERYLNGRYHATPPDLCLSIGPQALEFLMNRPSSLFPESQIVVGGVTPAQLATLPSTDGLVGRPMEWSIAPLLEALPEMRPEIRRILIVTGASDFDRARSDEALAQIAPFRERYQFEVSHGEDLDVVLERSSRLGDDALVFFISYFRTPDGRTLVPQDVAALVAAASSVPVVCIYDTYLGTGVLGGPVVPFEDEGYHIGKIARKISASRAGEAIGIEAPGRPRLVFDARVLKKHRWKISRLPTGTELRFREPGLWETHRNGVIAGVGLLVFQTGLIGSLLMARSRQRRAERERGLSESRFTGVFEGSPVSIGIIRQSDGRIVEVNPAWERTMGVAREMAVGKTHLEMGFEFVGSSVERFREYLASGKSLRDIEQIVQLPDGRQRLLSVSTELAILHETPCYISMAQDITDRREIDDARQQLAQASRLGMLGELTASIAHEVNQPLGAILSNAEAAEMLMESENPPWNEVRAILSDIRRDDLRASEVIQQVRSLVARGETRMVPLAPGELADAVARLVRQDCKRRNIALTCETQDGLPMVLGERTQIEQVLLNLLLNAMDAVKDQPPYHRMVELRALSTDDQQVEISVIDSGPGIPKNLEPRIFDRFFSTKADGMGLGLALSASIAETHGGRLIAENRAEGGACFRLILPSMP